jgi:hypothetical protein
MDRAGMDQMSYSGLVIGVMRTVALSLIGNRPVEYFSFAQFTYTIQSMHQQHQVVKLINA